MYSHLLTDRGQVKISEPALTALSMPSCAVVGCTAKGSLHRFPADEETRKKWFAFCGLDSTITISARVCSRHFVEADYIIDKKLKKGAVPSLLTGVPIESTSVIKNNDTSLENIRKGNMAEIEKVFIKVENDIEFTEVTRCEDIPCLPPPVDNQFQEESCDTLSEGDEVMVKEEDFEEYYFPENADNRIYCDESSIMADRQASGGNSKGISFMGGNQDLNMESTLEIKEEILEFDDSTHHYEESFPTLSEGSSQYNHEAGDCKTSAYSVSELRRKRKQEEERQKLQVARKNALTQGQKIGMVYDRYAMSMSSKDKKKDFFTAVIGFMVNYASTIEEC